MIASQFNLDHRLTELRPTTDEQRLARARDAGAGTSRGLRTVGDLVRERFGAAPSSARPSRIATA